MCFLFNPKEKQLLPDYNLLVQFKCRFSLTPTLPKGEGELMSTLPRSITIQIYGVGLRTSPLSIEVYFLSDTLVCSQILWFLFRWL